MELIDTEIENELVAIAGEQLKVKVAPPSKVTGVILPPLLDNTVKSVEDATVAPAVPETAILHIIVEPVLKGFVAVQVNTEAVVGLPTTTNEGDPLLMILEPT